MKNKPIKSSINSFQFQFLKCKSTTEEKKLQVFEICKWDACDYKLDSITDEPLYIGRVEMKLNEGKKRKFIYFQSDYKLKQ